MTTGKFGIHTGVVNHGGIASQPHLWGRDRKFKCNMTEDNWAENFKEPATTQSHFHPFAQRHGAWHWYAGFMEMHNTGGGGMENADQITPQVNDWLERKAKDKPFFMWLNVCNLHTPYRTPASFENPFKDEPIPEWAYARASSEHWKKRALIPRVRLMVLSRNQSGSIVMTWIKERFTMGDLQPSQIENKGDARKMFDGYDTGVSLPINK